MGCHCSCEIWAVNYVTRVLVKINRNCCFSCCWFFHFALKFELFCVFFIPTCILKSICNDTWFKQTYIIIELVILECYLVFGVFSAWLVALLHGLGILGHHTRVDTIRHGFGCGIHVDMALCYMDSPFWVIVPVSARNDTNMGMKPNKNRTIFF